MIQILGYVMGNGLLSVGGEGIVFGNCGEFAIIEICVVRAGVWVGRGVMRWIDL